MVTILDFNTSSSRTKSRNENIDLGRTEVSPYYLYFIALTFRLDFLNILRNVNGLLMNTSVNRSSIMIYYAIDGALVGMHKKNHLYPFGFLWKRSLALC